MQKGSGQCVFKHMGLVWEHQLCLVFPLTVLSLSCRWKEKFVLSWYVWKECGTQGQHCNAELIIRILSFFPPGRKLVLCAATNVAWVQSWCGGNINATGCIWRPCWPQSCSLSAWRYSESRAFSRTRRWREHRDSGHVCSNQPRVQHQNVHADSVWIVMYLLL